jgi:transposase
MAQDVCVIVGAEECARLAAVVGDRSRPLKHVQRAWIVLFSAERLPVLEVARRAGVSRPAVWRWQRRFAEEGVDGLLRDKTRPPGKPPLPAATVAKVLALTCTEPPGEATHWFAQKVEDIVGLYMHPPAHAVVLSIDEKSQIQALDRTQPGLPLKPGKCGTMTHDYKRNGTTTLFAALNVLEGTVLGRCMQKHTHQEFIRFLNAIERAVPAGKVIHAIADNYATHKHPKVRAWLARHPRWVFHFTPTSASWLNAVENFFSVLTRRRLKRGVFHSIADLQAAINRYIREHNHDPKPFVWTKPANTILAKINRIPVPSE